MGLSKWNCLGKLIFVVSIMLICSLECPRDIGLIYYLADLIPLSISGKWEPVGANRDTRNRLYANDLYRKCQ